MVLLSDPDEDRLWLVVSGLMGVALLLLLASFQVPWYTASWTSGSVEVHGGFDFNEAEMEIYSNGDLANDHTQAYGDDSAFGDLMGRVGVLVGLGTFATVAMGVLLFMHRRGWYSQPRLIGLSWLLGVGGIAAGLVIFTLGAGRAGADEVMRLLDAYAEGYVSVIGRPDPAFWGTQDYAGGELVSAPGVGWLLAALALLNLAAAVLLLYQFPSSQAQEDEADAETFHAADGEDRHADPEPVAVTHGPVTREGS